MRRFSKDLKYDDKPGMSPSGWTWDAQHLDKFLSSPWGEKLYGSKKIPESLNSSKIEIPPRKAFIKPSSSFLAPSRNTPCSLMITKSSSNSLVQWIQPKNLPKKVSLIEISTKMKAIDEQKSKSSQEYLQIMPPNKRKQLFEAEKFRNKTFSDLKIKKSMEIKKQRIIENEYKSGVLGYDSPDRLDDSLYYKKIQVENCKKNEISKAHSLKRMENIRKNTATSYHIQFFNQNQTVKPIEKPRGVKKVNANSWNYHNTVLYQ